MNRLIRQDCRFCHNCDFDGINTRLRYAEESTFLNAIYQVCTIPASHHRHENYVHIIKLVAELQESNISRSEGALQLSTI